MIRIKLVNFISKMNSIVSSLILLGLIINHFCYCLEKARFDFYRVYEVTTENEDQLNLFQLILDNPDGVSFIPQVFKKVNFALMCTII